MGRDSCLGVCHLMLVLAGSTTLREARLVTQAGPGSTGESVLKPMKCCDLPAGGQLGVVRAAVSNGGVS